MRWARTGAAGLHVRLGVVGQFFSHRPLGAGLTKKSAPSLPRQMPCCRGNGPSDHLLSIMLTIIPTCSARCDPVPQASTLRDRHPSYDVRDRRPQSSRKTATDRRLCGVAGTDSASYLWGNFSCRHPLPQSRDSRGEENTKDSSTKNPRLTTTWTRWAEKVPNSEDYLKRKRVLYRLLSVRGCPLRAVSQGSQIRFRPSRVQGTETADCEPIHRCSGVPPPAERRE